MSDKPKARRPKKGFTFLELKDRLRLIELLNDPVMQAALGNASKLKPGVFVIGLGTQVGDLKDAALATLMANNRLHEIRGWEMFETALFAQAEDPKVGRAQLNETYPDSGVEIS